MAIPRLALIASEGGAGGRYVNEAFQRIAQDPRDPDALFALAAILGVEGLRPEAIQVLTFLAEVAPRYPGLWRFKARLYREIGDEVMAARCMQSSSRLTD